VVFTIVLWCNGKGQSKGRTQQDQMMDQPTAETKTRSLEFENVEDSKA
jgi:hypothetical protein